MKTLVVIPTYDERANLERLIREVLRQSDDLQVLVVDDASPDGTGALADEMAARDERIHVLHRTAKEGLGTAYVEGFLWALEHDNADYILQMDADFSHDPGCIPDFLQAVESADLVLGSRYLTGVNVLNWSLRRLALSAFANHYAAWATGLPIKDLTSGFKCFRRTTLEKLPLRRFRSDGYAFQIELTYHVAKLGHRVAEIPIIFTDRVEGKSKLSSKIVWEAALLVWLLRFGRGS